MLHTLSHSLNQINVYHFMGMISDSDIVLLWQDGVTAGIKHTQLSVLLDKNYIIYALDNDVLARGLTDLMDNRIQIINMETCVKLTAENAPQVAW